VERESGLSVWLPNKPDFEFRLANHTPDEFLARISEMLANRHPRELLILQARISEIIRLKS